MAVFEVLFAHKKIKIRNYLHYSKSNNGLGTFGYPIGLLGKAPKYQDNHLYMIWDTDNAAPLIQNNKI